MTLIVYTSKLYQMYGRRCLAEDHAILRRYSAVYIILEDSICLASSKDSCRLLDVIDVDNDVNCTKRVLLFFGYFIKLLCALYLPLKTSISQKHGDLFTSI